MVFGCHFHNGVARASRREVPRMVAELARKQRRGEFMTGARKSRSRFLASLGMTGKIATSPKCGCRDRAQRAVPLHERENLVQASLTGDLWKWMGGYAYTFFDGDDFV